MNIITRIRKRAVYIWRDVFMYIEWVKLKYRHPHFVIRRKTTDSHVLYGVYVRKEFHLPFELSEEPKTIFDGGAYTGISSLNFHERYPGARIIAIEPESDNFTQLEHNVACFEQISLVKAALWSEDTHVEIYNRHDNDWAKWGFAAKAVSESNPDTVPARSVASLMREYTLPKIDILKLDIEGSEFNLFSAENLDWLDQVDVVIIELHDRIIPGCSNVVRKAFSGGQWKEFTVGEKVIFARETAIKK